MDGGGAVGEEFGDSVVDGESFRFDFGFGAHAPGVDVIGFEVEFGDGGGVSAVGVDEVAAGGFFLSDSF